MTAPRTLQHVLPGPLASNDTFPNDEFFLEPPGQALTQAISTEDQRALANGALVFVRNIFPQRRSQSVTQMRHLAPTKRGGKPVLSANFDGAMRSAYFKPAPLRGRNVAAASNLLLRDVQTGITSEQTRRERCCICERLVVSLANFARSDVFRGCSWVFLLPASVLKSPSSQGLPVV